MWLGARPAVAHPVAQGALAVVIFQDRITVRVRPAREEVLLAATLGGQTEPSPVEMVRRHGDYLLAHLRVSTDGRVLDGRVARVPESAVGQPTYELEYRLSGDAPGSVELWQDVLHEFEFAPGNPWEASYLVRVGGDGQSPVEGLLLTSRHLLRVDCGGRATPGAPPLDRVRMAATFARHGVEHILAGYDHLLFVAALVLAATRLRDLIGVIGAFTVAHTITLALAALDVFRLPGRIVEPMIAASIVVVAAQNVLWPKRSRGAGRMLVAFLFGLFHGLGFAGGLLDAMADLHAGAALLAIGAFSLGVEVGHQLVVLPAFVGLRFLHQAGGGPAGHARAQRYGSAVISLAGLVYLVAALR